jgi:hypothetical protein
MHPVHRFDMPQCRRDREVCLGELTDSNQRTQPNTHDVHALRAGTCGGNATALKQDFMTFASKAELSERVLGTDKIARGRANCSVKTHTFEVDLFEGALGEQFILYASRLRVRGGFTGARLAPIHQRPYLAQTATHRPTPVRSNRPASVRRASGSVRGGAARARAGAPTRH